MKVRIKCEGEIPAMSELSSPDEPEVFDMLDSVGIKEVIIRGSANEGWAAALVLESSTAVLHATLDVDLDDLAARVEALRRAMGSRLTDGDKKGGGA